MPSIKSILVTAAVAIVAIIVAKRVPTLRDFLA
jgi:hypothetical protein